MSRIFVSHSSTDVDAAKEFRDWLLAQGHVSYFLDVDPEKGLVAGRRWEDELYRNLRRCRAVVALLSPAWLASRWCFAEVTQARAAGKPVFFVQVAKCDSAGTFADVQHVDLTTDKAEGLQRLARGLKDVGIEPGEAFDWDPSRPPYPGLTAFHEEDAAVFFGRDRDIQRGLETLARCRRTGGPAFVLFLGGSGSGKSSLVRAGLIPRLRKDRATWLPITPFRPKEQPFAELANALSVSFTRLGDPRDWRELAQALESAADGVALLAIARDLRSLAGQSDATLLLTVDQAEELFTVAKPDKAAAFLACLRAALDSGGDLIMAMATMRSDMLGGFQAHPALAGFTYQTVTVDPILLRDLPQIIEGPAQLADIALGPGLVPTLVEDATTGDALPLLAFTLRELYERHGQDRRLDLADYEALGRLEGSVCRAADGVIEQRSPSDAELEALKAAFVPAMVRVNNEGRFVRRRARWADLPAAARPLLEGFVEARLLVSAEDAGERVVEVAHEALFRSWPRLQRWLTEEADRLRVIDDVQDAAEDWDRHARQPSWLVHHGGRLQAAEELTRESRYDDGLGDTAAAYLSACIARRKAERATARRRRIAGAFAALAVIAAAGVAGVFFLSAEQQRQQTRIADSEKLAIVSREQTGAGDATLGMLLALEALPPAAAREPEHVYTAEASLLLAMSEQREKRILLGHGAAVLDVAFSPTRPLVMTCSADGTALVWDLGNGDVVAILAGHEGAIGDCEFSGDGRRTVTASTDGSARIWDVAAQVSLVELRGQAGAINTASFSPDGKRVVTASKDGIAQLWNATTGMLELVLAGHAGQVYRAVFSPDGRRVATASEDKTARIWDARTGRVLAVLRGHEDGVYGVAFSPNGERLATASWDKSARLWNAVDNDELPVVVASQGARRPPVSSPSRLIATMSGHRDGVENVIFSPNGALLATYSWDGTARLWSAVTGEATATLEGHAGQVFDLAFSPDGDRLVTASDDGTARLWRVATGQTVAVFRGHRGPVWSVAFAPDGQTVATAADDREPRLWDATSPRSAATLNGHQDWVYHAMFSPDGRRVASVSKDGTARLWKADTGHPVATLVGHTGQVLGAAFSPSSRLLLTWSEDGTAKLWDASTGDLVRTLAGHGEGPLFGGAFSPDERRVVTASKDKTARVWDVVTGRTEAVLEGHGGAVSGVAYSHSGGQIATRSDDKTVRLWDAASGKSVATLQHDREAWTTVFSPDDGRLATGSFDGKARLWSVASAALLADIEAHSAAVTAVTFSPDGRRLATASWDNTARLWDANTGQPLVALLGHDGRVDDIRFSSDGKLVLTASWDRTARLWHAASGLAVARFTGHTDQVTDANFSPDGRRVVTASWDGTVRVWMLPMGSGEDWRTAAERTKLRDLSEAERNLYVRKPPASLPRSALSAVLAR